MDKRSLSEFSLLRAKRGFTRLEFSLLTAMLGAMVINGIATLGGGLGVGSKPMGLPDVRVEQSNSGSMNAAVGFSRTPH